MKKTIQWEKTKNYIVLVCTMTMLVFTTLDIIDAAAKLKINKNKVTVYVGNTVQLKVLRTKSKIIWKSNKTKIARVSKNGKVKGVREGKAVITAKVKGRKYSCKVIVKNIAINKTNTELQIGDALSLKVLGNKKKISWYSDDVDIADVTEKGVVTAKKEGITIINAKIGKKIYCCVVVVKEKEAVTICPSITTSNLPVNTSETTVSVSEIPVVTEGAITTPGITSDIPAITITPTSHSSISTPVVSTPSAIFSNPYLQMTSYVSKEENIGKLNFVLPEKWINQTKNSEDSVYQAYFPQKENETQAISGVLVGNWEKGGLTESNLEMFINSKMKLEKEKMEKEGLTNVSAMVSSCKMDIGNVMVSFWKFTSDGNIQTMLVYDVIVKDYLVEIQIGDMKDNVEPGVYDVGRNILNSLRVKE